MKIFRNGKQIHDLAIDDKTTIKRRLMVENSLNLSVAVAVSSPLDLKIGDYTDLGSERYIIMDDPTYSLRNGVYDYDVLMRGNLHRLEVYMMPDEGRDEWFYYGSIVDQINKVVDILNTKEVGWSVVLPNITELSNIAPKDINYANMSILSAFHAICNAENGWGLEFDVVGKTIVFGKEIKNPTQMRFEHGKGNGLYELSRGKTSGEKIATRIIGYGGKANMPNGQRLDFSDINGGNNYIDKNIDKYGLRETRVNFDHIFPRLKDATITANATQVQAGKANWTVVTALDFDLTQQVLDESVIVFQTGDCAGVEFKIVAYDHATKTITFTEDANESGVEVNVLPNAKRYPKAGDQYVLINILMPDSYITAAKNELKSATIAEADRIAIPQRSYSVKCDPRYFKALGVTPLVGDGLRIIDAPHGVDYVSRIIEINYPVIYPHNIEMVLADKIPIPGTVVLSKSVNDAKNKVAALDRSKLTENQLSKMYHPLGGDLAKPLAMSEQRLASVDGGYVEIKTGFLDGVGAPNPPAGGGDGGTTDYVDLTNKPQINGIALVGNKTLAELGIQSLIPANTYALFGHGHSWESIAGKPYTFTPSAHGHTWIDITDKPTTFTPSAHVQAISTITGLQAALDVKADLNGSLVQSFAMSALRLASTAGVYIEIKSGYLDGTGAPNPPAGGGGGSSNYNDVENKPQINGVTLVGNKTLGELGVPMWALQAVKPSYVWAEIGSKPTTLVGYGITDAVLNSDVRLTNARPASDVYAWAKASVKPSYTGSEIDNNWHTGNFNPYIKFNINEARGLNNTSDANRNTVWFDYNWAGTSKAGSVISFSGLGGHYNTELFGDYLLGDRFGVRTRQGDTNVWNPVRWLYHTGNLAPASTNWIANTLAQRDGNGYLSAEIFRDNWIIDNLLIGAVGFKTSQEDGYHRFCTPEHFKAQLGLWSTSNLAMGRSLGDANTIADYGIYRVYDHSINTPINLGGHTMLHLEWDINAGAQMFFGYATEQYYLRKKAGRVWSPWREIWHSGNSNLATADWSMRNAHVNGNINIASAGQGTLQIGNTNLLTGYPNGGHSTIKTSSSAIFFDMAGRYAGAFGSDGSYFNIHSGGSANGVRVSSNLTVTGKAKCDSLIINNYNASGVVNGTSEIISKDYA